MNREYFPVHHRQTWIDEQLDLIRTFNSGNQLVDRGLVVPWSGIKVTLNEIYNHIFFGTNLNSQGMPYCPSRLYTLLEQILSKHASTTTDERCANR